MATVTLATMRTRLRRRLEDTDSSNPHWPDSELNQYINEAQQDFYDLLYINNRYFLPTTEVNYDWPANQVSLNLTTQVAYRNDFDIILISAFLDSDNVLDSSNTTNYPIPMYRMNYEEMYRRADGKALYEDTWDIAGLGLDPNIQSKTWGSAGGGYRWAILSKDTGTMGEIHMYMSPVPEKKIKLNFLLLLPFAELSLDSDPILNNQFNRFIDIIEYGAVIKAKGRSDEQTDPVVQSYLQRVSMLERWLEAKSRTGTPRVIVDGY